MTRTWKKLLIWIRTHRKFGYIPHLVKSYSSSPAGVKKVPVAGQYNSKIA
jgi:hypothetical protein